MTVLGSVKFEEMTVAINSLGGLLNQFDRLTSNYVFNITSDFFYQAFIMFDKIDKQCTEIFDTLSQETIFVFKKDFTPLFNTLKQQISLVEIMLKQLEQVENVASLKGTYYKFVSRIEEFECIVSYPLEFVKTK